MLLLSKRINGAMTLVTAATLRWVNQQTCAASALSTSTSLSGHLGIRLPQQLQAASVPGPHLSVLLLT